MIIRRLIAPAAAAAFALHAVSALAQGAFPAPLPSQSAASPFPAPLPNQSGAPAPQPQSSPFPPVSGGGGSFPVNGAAPLGGGGGAFGPPQASPMGQQAGGDACMNDFLKLRKEAEKRGAAIQAAGKRKAPATEACKLIGSFSAAENQMIKYVISNAKRCGIPPEIAEQLKNGHKNTEAMQQKVCNIAEQQSRGPAGPSLADVIGSSTAAPEANTTARKFGGTTFDTLNGNVLAR